MYGVQSISIGGSCLLRFVIAFVLSYVSFVMLNVPQNHFDLQDGNCFGVETELSTVGHARVQFTPPSDTIAELSSR